MPYTHQGKVDFIHAVARRLLKANVPFEMKFYGQNRMTLTTDNEATCMVAVDQEKARLEAQLKMQPREELTFTRVELEQPPQDDVQAVIDEDVKGRMTFPRRISETEQMQRVVADLGPRYASGEGTQANVRKQNQDLVERDRQRWTCIPHGLLNCSACF